MAAVDYVHEHLKADMKPVIPRFVTQAVKMEHASQQAGRPIFEEREYVEILIPGIRNTMAFEPVNEEHKARWPDQYAAFKAGQDVPLSGTPLSEWPSSHINKARIEELAFFHIRTVEELASLDDAKIMNIGMGGRELVNAAKKFLEVARTGTGPLESMLARLDKQAADIERLTATVAEQASVIKELRGGSDARA